MNKFNPNDIERHINAILSVMKIFQITDFSLMLCSISYESAYRKHKWHLLPLVSTEEAFLEHFINTVICRKGQSILYSLHTPESPYMGLFSCNCAIMFSVPKKFEAQFKNIYSYNNVVSGSLDKESYVWLYDYVEHKKV